MRAIYFRRQSRPGLEKAELIVPEAVRRLELIEVSSSAGGDVSPALGARVEKWRNAGIDVRAASVAGPSFWQTTEIEECPDLIGASLSVLAGVRGQ